MRGLTRFLLLLFCAEWLITLRIWLAPQVLLSFVAMAALRFFLYGFIPYWKNAYVIFPLAILALLWRLRAFTRGSRAPRAFYETPDDGVPWLVIVTRSQRAAFGLESLLAFAFALWLALSSPLFYPPGLRDLPPSWGSWLSQHGEGFATLHAFLAWLTLVSWNLTQGDAARQSRRRPEEGYARVREHSHSLPHLPTVKELAAEFSGGEAP